MGRSKDTSRLTPCAPITGGNILFYKVLVEYCLE